MSSQVVTEGELIERDDLSEDRDQQEELFTLYDEMSEGDRNETTINVVRVPVDVNGNQIPGSKVGGHLFQALLGTMSKNDIIIKARKFIRAGQTSIMIRVTGSRKGRRGPLFHKIFTVERENIEEKPAGDQTAELFKLIQENQRVADERNQQFMQQMLGMQSQALTARATQAAVDPMDSAVKMMAAMGAMMGALMQGRAPGMAPPASPTDDLLKMITVMQKIGVMGGKPVDGSEDDSIGSIVKSVSSVLAPALQIFAANKMEALKNEPKRLAPPKRPVLRLKKKPETPAQAPATDPKTIVPPVDPTAQTSSPTENQNTELTEEQKMELEKMKSNLRQICAMAAAGQKPEAVADLVLSVVPDEEASNFYDMVSDPQYIARCELLVEEVTKHRAFFEALRAAILDAYEPDGVA